jgi:hypothetical protein
MSVFFENRSHFTASLSLLPLQQKHHIVPCGPKLPSKTAFRCCPPSTAPAQDDNRSRRKDVLQHLPSIAAQPYIHPCLDLTGPDDRSEPALKKGGSDKTLFQGCWVRNDVGHKQPNVGA